MKSLLAFVCAAAFVLAAGVAQAAPCKKCEKCAKDTTACPCPCHKK